MKEKILTIVLSLFCLTVAGQNNQNSKLLGDVNGDENVDVADLVIINNYILKKTPADFDIKIADINCDGIIDYNDFHQIIDVIMGNPTEYLYIHEETIGEEAIVASNGDFVFQQENEYGGHYILICPFDYNKMDWTKENCILVDVGENEQVKSIIFSDYVLVITIDENGREKLAIIEKNGEFEILGNLPITNKARAQNIKEEPTFIERLSFVNNYLSSIANIIEESGKGFPEKLRLGTNLFGTIMGAYLGSKIKETGFDFSGTFGSAISIEIEAFSGFYVKYYLNGSVSAIVSKTNIIMFLLTVADDLRKYCFSKLIGNQFEINYIKTQRKYRNIYQACYTVKGIKDDVEKTPVIDLCYYPKDKMVGSNSFPELISHESQNESYIDELKNLRSGPNHLIMDVYIKEFPYNFLGSFKRKRIDFFVDFNNLSHVGIKDYDVKNGKIIQNIEVYTTNNDDVMAFPLAEYGSYIRKGNKITRYNHTENLIQPNPEGASISAENSIIQGLILEIDLKELEFSALAEKKVSTYYIGAYSYNFDTGDYDYYDEEPLDLRYNIGAVTLDPTDVNQTFVGANCAFYGISIEDAVCGIEYWSEDFHKDIIVEIEDDGEYNILLDGLIPNTQYSYRAFLKIGELYFKANDTKSFETTYNPNVILKDFKQNASYHFPGYYMEMDATERMYDYKFYTQFAFQVENPDKIVRWGCLYKGPSGRYCEKIFFEQEMRTNEGEVYFNKMTSSEHDYELVIIPFVLEDRGASGWYREYGQKYHFDLHHNGIPNLCPDNNHPHLIDLGLKSGTKWACCNLGASNPQQSGGHYSWGETAGEKPFYDWSTYDYALGFENYTYIGDDISGTVYDSVTKLWDSPWQMPTEEQARELLAYDDAPSGEYNGVNGRYVVHYNGSFLFLPDSGNRLGYDLFPGGFYWTSTLDKTKSPLNSKAIYTSHSDWNIISIVSHDRYFGNSIRPVQNGNNK